MRRQQTRADLPDDITLAELRREWAAQPGIKLVREERCRRRGVRELWQLWEWTPKRAPAKGPRSSYVVLLWWRTGWNSWICLSHDEAEQTMRHRGTVPGALLPPLY